MKIMAFNYELPPQNEGKTGVAVSQETQAALFKTAIGTTDAEKLVGKSESLTIEELKGKIESQAEKSVEAATELIYQLNRMRSDNYLTHIDAELFRDDLDLKLSEWAGNGSLEWCANYIEKNGGDMVLVATPNALVNSKEIEQLVHDFGSQDLPREEPTISPNIEYYQPQELSGPFIGESWDYERPQVKLSLIPISPDTDLIGTVEYQKTSILNLQSEQANLRVPNVLETITYWQTLRGQGQLIEGAYLKTCTRHLDLPALELSGGEYVLQSYYNDLGEQFLAFFDSEHPLHTRLAVG